MKLKSEAGRSGGVLAIVGGSGTVMARLLLRKLHSFQPNTRVGTEMRQAERGRDETREREKGVERG